MGKNDSSSWELRHGTYSKSRIAHSFLLQGTQLPVSVKSVLRYEWLGQLIELLKAEKVYRTSSECGARGREEQTRHWVGSVTHAEVS